MNKVDWIIQFQAKIIDDLVAAHPGAPLTPEQEYYALMQAYADENLYAWSDVQYIIDQVLASMFKGKTIDYELSASPEWIKKMKERIVTEMTKNAPPSVWENVTP